MKKNKTRKLTHVVNKLKKERLRKSMIIELSNGKKFDYFKLPLELREQFKNIPAVAQMLKEF